MLDPEYMLAIHSIGPLLSASAVVQVRLDRQTSDSVARFEKEILKYPQVLECYLIAGDWITYYESSLANSV